MKNFNSLTNIALSVVFVTLVTSLILPGRQTSRVIGSSGRAFSGVLRAAQGR